MRFRLVSIGANWNYSCGPSVSASCLKQSTCLDFVFLDVRQALHDLQEVGRWWMDKTLGQAIPCRVHPQYPACPAALIASPRKKNIGAYRKRTRSIQPNRYVSTDASCKMNLCFKIELDSQQQRCILWLAVVVDGTLDDVACRAVEVGGGGDGADVA